MVNMSQTEMGIFARCCRLCLSENNDTPGNEDTERSVVLRERILAFLSIDINQNDTLSKHVCEECSKKVNNWCEFKKNCQRNQTTLTSWANEGAQRMVVQVKEEVIEDDDPPLEPDDIEIVNENITVKTEPPFFDNFDDSLVNGGTADHPDEDQVYDDESSIQMEEEEHEEQTNGEVPSGINITRRFSEQSHSEKIEFAAGLKLIKKDSTPIEIENLSPLEYSYIEKCKAMVEMYRTLKCACHLATHPNLKGLLSHLRSMKMWFPAFSCFNCMITFTDRSSSGKHLHRCPNKNLDTLVKLSNLKKRSSLKTRIYQNYRCIKCRFIYSFHEDFCKHVDEEHCQETAPFLCSCHQRFETLEDYKDHIYVSCMVEYYCDICNIAVRTLKEFINHANHHHDNSEGFTILQDDNYKRRSFTKVEPRENKEILGKRRSSTYGRSLALDEVGEDYETPSKLPRSSRSIPTKCPQCDKVYSCQANMLRHFKTHQSEVKQENPDSSVPENSYYRCPDCKIMLNADDWETHKESHEQIKCSECDKVFLFQTELEQHRGVHLNLKVYRDSKTDSYKSTMLSPNPEMPICDICNILCENFEDLESHKLSHEDLEDEGVPIELSKYSCLICNKHFAAYADYNEHNLKLHADRQISNNVYPRQCDECDKVVSSGSAFASHKAMHRRLRDDSSRISKPESPQDKSKSRKSDNQEGEDYHTCKRCFKVFSSRYNLKMHMKLHGINVSTTGRNSRSPRKFHCDPCNLNFVNNEALNDHINEEHDDMPELEEFNNGPYIFTCDVCVQTFSNKSALIQHKSKHHSQESGPSREDKKFVTYCKYCKIGFGRTEDLDKHMVNAHSEIPVPSKDSKATNKVFSCKICNKSFSTQTAMYAHQGWHKRTSNSGPLITQSKKYISPAIKKSPFECDVCGQVLPNDTALRVHTMEKHEDVAALLTPKCEPCNQEFGSQTEYDNHMRLHEIVENQKKMNYNCQLCTASFSKSETLQAHIKISHPTHLQEFKCPHCNRSFDKQASLTNHIKVHEKQKVVVPAGPKPTFQCSICNMGFNVPKDLRTHTITAHPF